MVPGGRAELLVSGVYHCSEVPVSSVDRKKMKRNVPRLEKSAFNRTRSAEARKLIFRKSVAGGLIIIQRRVNPPDRKPIPKYIAVDCGSVRWSVGGRTSRLLLRDPPIRTEGHGGDFGKLPST